MAIENGSHVSIEYVGRLPDGTVFDTSREEVAEESGLTDDPHNQGREWQPLQFEVGANQVIEGMEDGLEGLEVGDTKTITVPPEKGYGEVRDDLYQEFERGEFEEMVDQEAEVGMHVHAQNGAHGDVTEVTDDIVKLDFNHDLAGETLEFEVEVLTIE